jgi:hypothetical protein
LDRKSRSPGKLRAVHDPDRRGNRGESRQEALRLAVTRRPRRQRPLPRGRGYGKGHLHPAHPKILIGGLELGLTLKRTFELVGSPARVDVAELMPLLIEWNRTHLVKFNGPLLETSKCHLDCRYCFTRLLPRFFKRAATRQGHSHATLTLHYHFSEKANLRIRLGEGLR